jgi:L-fuconolactonase
MVKRIDSHQHFWHYNPAEHTWMNKQMSVLKTNYLPNNIKPLLTESGIDGTVAVQARQNLDETEFLLDLSAQYELIQGVVGWVDMRSDDMNAQLEKYAPHPKFVGVRHVVHDEPDDQFMLGDAFLRGLAQLQKHNLTYDLLLFPKHIPIAIEVVKQFPEQHFVLDHIAKPLIKDSILEPWATDIRKLATYENVYCKVSGMVTEAKWNEWTQSDYVQYLDVVFECFGSERLMYGSDWPVCTLSGSYSQVIRIVETYIAKLSDNEQAKIMGGNAAHFYDLK